MNKILLAILACFGIINSISSDTKTTTINDISNVNNYEYSYNNIIKNKDDIKKAIYNGLNDDNDIITLYCGYDNYNDCLNDFYNIYENKMLMKSINNYVSPYNKFSTTRYRININNGKAKIAIDINRKYTKKQIKEIDNKIDIYLRKLDLNNMSDMGKIKWAHDFIIKRNEYDDIATEIGKGDAYSAYGALVGNQAVCQGYAEAMAILLDKFNIPNIMISNNVHMWNLVNINGKWLHLDLTWDDLMSSDESQTIRYDYFLVTTIELPYLDSSINHLFDKNYYLEA